jgi:5-methylthioadenosine/S-adenosylhomocysteine deaminase
MRHFCNALCTALLLCARAQATESADWIIQARYIVTMNAQHQLIDDGAIAIRGAHIVGVGPRTGIAQRFHAREVLDEPDSLVAPGLIDTHTHAPMSLLRGIANDVPLEVWLTKFIFPAESKNVTADFVRWGTRLACLEMVVAGITT